MLNSFLSRFRSGGDSRLPLILGITSVYAPFLGNRLLRMAGDEKVYISQAIEMQRAGVWFLQRLQDEPDYYKGPFHYIALRIGFWIFGKNPWAVLYMNYILVTLGALALASLVRKRLPHWKGGDLWTALAFALGAGVYAHAWASQMEVELASLFAIILWLLDRTPITRGGFAVWAVIGLCAWVKSPLHAAIFGTSTLLYWILSGEIVARIKNPLSWLAGLTGIAIGIAGYLPAYLWDHDSFWNTYIVRETLAKGGTGQHWSVSIDSFFGFYLFPWVLIAIVAYLQLPFVLPKLLKNAESRKTLALSIAGFVPSVAFFLWHPYHFENYNLPVIAALWLLFALILSTVKRGSVWGWLYGAASKLTSLVFVAIAILITVIQFRLAVTPSWWPHWLLPLVWIGSLLSAWAAWTGRVDSPRRLAWAAVPYLWALTALFATVGERELVDLRSYLAEADLRGDKTEIGYFNLGRNIWSEWGYMNFWLGREVRGLNNPEQAKAAIARGDLILVQNKESQVADFKAFLEKEAPGVPVRFHPWKRWRTQGRTESGQPLWQEAWNRRDLTPLEVDYLIVETRPK